MTDIGKMQVLRPCQQNGICNDIPGKNLEASTMPLRLNGLDGNLLSGCRLITQQGRQPCQFGGGDHGATCQALGAGRPWFRSVSRLIAETDDIRQVDGRGKREYSTG